MNIHIPRALGGISLITAGVMGLVAIYNDCRAIDAVSSADRPVADVAEEHDHSVELDTLVDDDSVEIDPIIDAGQIDTTISDDPDEPQEVINPEPIPMPQAQSPYMDPAIVDALFMTAVKPVMTPVVQAAVKNAEVPSVGKLLSPKDVQRLREINDLLQARARTNNWDMRFPIVERSNVLWRKSEYKVPAGLTLSMVVFTKEETPILYARGDLILDTLSREDQTVLRRKDSIIKSITAPTAFPPNATPIGVGTTVTMKSYVRKNRAYFGIPLRLVLSDGDPRLDACLMITTTSGQTLPSIERLIPVAMEATMGLFIAARASKLIDTKNITLTA